MFVYPVSKIFYFASRKSITSNVKNERQEILSKKDFGEEV
jgi:ribosomal protein L24E